MCSSDLVACSSLVFNAWVPGEGASYLILRLGAAALTLFIIETTPRIALFSADQAQPFRKLWLHDVAWSLPYYLGALLLGLAMSAISSAIGWPTVVASTPAVYLIFRTYRIYLHRLEDQKVHAEEIDRKSTRLNSSH